MSLELDSLTNGVAQLILKYWRMTGYWVNDTIHIKVHVVHHKTLPQIHVYTLFLVFHRSRYHRFPIPHSNDFCILFSGRSQKVVSCSILMRNSFTFTSAELNSTNNSSR